MAPAPRRSAAAAGRLGSTPTIRGRRWSALRWPPAAATSARDGGGPPRGAPGGGAAAGVVGALVCVTMVALSIPIPARWRASVPQAAAFLAG